jgi:pyruvate formate lyase activating enzyme
VIRVPLVPGVTDTDANLAEVARRAAGLGNLRGVELLRYNRAAGGKYTGLGMRFEPKFDQDADVNADTAPFRERGLEVTVR